MKKIFLALWLSLGGCVPGTYDMTDNKVNPSSIEDLIKATIGVKTEHIYKKGEQHLKVEGGASAFGFKYDSCFTYFLTAQHISAHPAEVNGVTYTASSYTFKDNHPLWLVCEDKEVDLAVYRTEGIFDTFDDFADVERIKTGIRVYSVGFPYMLGSYLRYGVMAGRNENHIILDQHTNFGDSGSPVVALDGGEAKLIGVTTVKYIMGEGIGGIVPIDKVKDFLKRNGL